MVRILGLGPGPFAVFILSFPCFTYSSPLKTEVVVYSETLVLIYQASRCRIPQDSNINSHSFCWSGYVYLWGEDGDDQQELITKKPVKYIYQAIYVLLLVITFLSILRFQIYYWEHLSLFKGCIYNNILLSQWRCYVRYYLKREFSFIALCSVFQLDLKVYVVEPH